MTAAVNGVKELLAEGGKATPGLVALIDSMIKIIDDEIKTKVKEYQISTQTNVDTKITTLTDRTESAVKEKEEADQFDRSYDQCTSEEQRLLEAHETCKTQEAKLTAEVPTTAFCGNPDFDVAYSNPPTLATIWTVDFSKGSEAVALEIDGYLTELNTWVANKKRHAQQHQDKWNDANTACTDKTNELEAKTKDCGDKLAAWTTQNAKCAHAKRAQEVSMCDFGHKYQA